MGFYFIWRNLKVDWWILEIEWINCVYYLRPLPPLPNLEISEDIAIKAADEMRVWVNYALSIAHDIAIGGNWILFFKVFTWLAPDWCFVCQSWLFQLLIVEMFLAMLIRLQQSCGWSLTLAVSSTFLPWFTLVSMNSVMCWLDLNIYSANSNMSLWHYFATGVILSLSLPVVYDKYQKPIDDKLSVAYDVARIQYEKIDALILQKIPLPTNKEKKTQ